MFLLVDGQRVEYRNGPEEWHAMVWPNKAAGGNRGASLRVRTADGTEETIQQDGDWGLFRLLEQGNPKGEPGARDFAIGFEMTLGATVVVDFRTERSESPFFGSHHNGGRLLDAFHSLPPAPPGIGAAGSCE